MIQGVLCNDPLEDCLVHFIFQNEILPTTKVGNAYYGVDEEHVDYVLALESLPSEECPGGQLDVTVSVLKGNKSHGELSSSLKEGPVLK